MFGAVAVMVDDAMAVAAYKDGSLLVRVDPAEDARLLHEPDVSRAEMGAGRSMGEGWIRVGARALSSDPALDDWLENGHGLPGPAEARQVNRVGVSRCAQPRTR